MSTPNATQKVNELKQILREKALLLNRGGDDTALRARMEILEAILVDYLDADQRDSGG